MLKSHTIASICKSKPKSYPQTKQTFLREIKELPHDDRLIAPCSAFASTNLNVLINFTDYLSQRQKVMPSVYKGWSPETHNGLRSNSARC